MGLDCSEVLRRHQCCCRTNSLCRNGCIFKVSVASCRMTDPDATKPDDWDEDAPRQIEDDDAEKPDGWLDDEPAEIDDPGKTTQQPCIPTSTSSACPAFQTLRRGLLTVPWR